MLAVLMMIVGAGQSAEIVLPPVRYPALPVSAAGAEGFTPRGWRVEAQARGDLSGDGIADLAFVLRMNDPANVLAHDGLGDNPFDTNPRILAVALGVPGGGYRLAAQDHDLIARRDYPTQSDPFEGEFAIARGSLNVTVRLFMSAGGWDASSAGFRFSWRDNGLRLIGYDYRSVQRNSGLHDRPQHQLPDRPREAQLGPDRPRPRDRALVARAGARLAADRQDRRRPRLRGRR